MWYKTLSLFTPRLVQLAYILLQVAQRLLLHLEPLYGSRLPLLQEARVDVVNTHAVRGQHLGRGLYPLFLPLRARLSNTAFQGAVLEALTRHH